MTKPEKKGCGVLVITVKAPSPAELRRGWGARRGGGGSCSRRGGTNFERHDGRRAGKIGRTGLVLSLTLFDIASI